LTFQIDPVAVTAFVLGLVRATAWVYSAPPFNTKGIPGRVKIGIAAALALAAAPTVTDAKIPVDTGGFIGALMTQVLVGLALGFVTMLLFAAIQAAGSMIDMFAGFSIAQVYDPLSQANAAVFGRFYQLLATTLLFAVNGHLLLVKGFLTSFQAVPTSGLELGDFSRLLTHDMSMFFVAAIEVAAPVLGVLFLAEVALGLLARAAPQMNIMNFAFGFRIIVALLLVGVAIPLVGPAVSNLIGHVLSGTAPR
jgi:flagellar biosynthetic protein FliR